MFEGILQMKKQNQMVNQYGKNLTISVTLLLCLFFISLMIFSASKIFATDVKESQFSTPKVFYQNQNPIDLDKIIKENTFEKVKQEMVVEQTDLEYTTIYRNNPDLPSGMMQVLQEGRAGLKNAIIIKKYQEDILVSEQQMAENILKAPVERIVEIGTGKMDGAPKPKIGDTIYVVSTSLCVKLEPNEQAEKICTLHKGDTAKILRIEGDWYFISTVEIKGYVQSNCVTIQNPNQEKIEEKSQFTKQELLNRLSLNMDLRKPSGLTLEQFKKIFAQDEKDKNGVFEQNAEYFYYAEKQYGINGIFVAAVGAHESAWGTSAISKNKKNLFGYGAVDSNPYQGAYEFESYAEGIDLVCRVFVKYYLNPSGTVIYDGNVASGKFYGGSNLTAVNTRYASDKNWANAVYKWMQYFYNKIET